MYPHMPILHPHAARFHERRISSVKFTSAHLYGNVYMRVGVARALADSSDFGLLEEQSPPKWEIPCLGRRWTAEQNLTPLALSSAEKFVTVRAHTQTNKQTNKHTHTHIHTHVKHVVGSRDVVMLPDFIDWTRFFDVVAGETAPLRHFTSPDKTLLLIGQHFRPGRQLRCRQ